MSSKNLAKTQLLFGDLSLKTKPSTQKPPSATTTLTTTTTPSATSLSSGIRSNAFYKKSPEIHDLIRFQNAIMMKYYQTQDPHFKNMADALKPQIEDKIREFNQNH